MCENVCMYVNSLYVLAEIFAKQVKLCACTPDGIFG